MPIGRYHQIDKTAIRYVGGFEIENQEQYERLVKQFGEFISILRRKRLEKRPSGDGDIEQSSPQQEALINPLPLWSRKLRVKRNLKLNRMGAPSSG